jgi:triosephosphate isomerase
MARAKLLLGNWKMNKTVSEAKSFALNSKEIAKFAKDNGVLVGVAPTYLCLQTVKENVADNMIVAAQNCHFEDSGAFTGEVSIPMLEEIGIKWVIIGHSERRTYDNETNEKCNQKIVKLVAHDMVPVYCVGETLEQYVKGETKAVVEKQIRIGLSGLSKESIKKVVIAYEPVWAIGTGKNATQEIAEDVCAFIRDVVAKMYGEASEDVLVLYGGSVKPENIKAYLSSPDIDGALVGGASLKLDSYQAMLENLVK